MKRDSAAATWLEHYRRGTLGRSNYKTYCRMLTIEETAFYIGKSTSWLRSHLPHLVETGFPPQNPILKRFDKVLIDKWLEQYGPRDDTAAAGDIPINGRARQKLLEAALNG